MSGPTAPTITEFLLEQIERDELVARNTLANIHFVREMHGPVGWYVQHFDPARVLAECEAKRRIVTDSAAGAAKDTDDWACVAWAVLCDLASIYADHPDYREEWKP